VRIAQVVPRGEQPARGVLTVIVHLSAAFFRRGQQAEMSQLHGWTPDTTGTSVRVSIRDASWSRLSSLLD
jgi:hypothetical protein